MTVTQRLGLYENKNNFDKDLERQEDLLAFERFNEMKLVNIKSTMLKTPEQRSKKEIEYICLYLRQHFEIFADIEKEDLKNIMKRLEPEIYPPGQMFARADKKCLNMTLIIEGVVDAVDKYDPSNMKDYGEKGQTTNLKVRSYGELTTLGSECFYQDEYLYP